ncbi:hypothetical protein CZ771_01085 [Actinomycetales bacterium JB111]|nr:hypothetical protein CZ771_01085 [Actinomycetales bacterium JB111]
MQHFPRPQDRSLAVEREPIDGTCPECGGHDLAGYPVLSEGGWWDVVKCQGCLASVRRNPAPPLGSFTPLSELV